MAWVVGHKGRVPYNLTMLLNGEKVSRKRWTPEHMMADGLSGAGAVG
jgi:hypothetical protein